MWCWRLNVSLVVKSRWTSPTNNYKRLIRNNDTNSSNQKRKGLLFFLQLHLNRSNVSKLVSILQGSEATSVLCHMGNLNADMEDGRQSWRLTAAWYLAESIFYRLSVMIFKDIHNCNKELYNVICDESPYSKAKIGITTNNQNDCDSCDFRIGFGSEGEFDDSNTRGNETSRSGTDNGDKHIREIGYILIHWEQNETKTIRKRKLARLKGYGWNHNDSKVWMERWLKRAFEL